MPDFQGIAVKLISQYAEILVFSAKPLNLRRLHYSASQRGYLKFVFHSFNLDGMRHAYVFTMAF